MIADRCENCTEKCKQAEMAHEAVLGRMYATNEFLSLLKKVESGVLVEVVRCQDCKYWHEETGWCYHHSHFIKHNGEFCYPWESNEWKMFDADYHCADGERVAYNEENDCI